MNRHFAYIKSAKGPTDFDRAYVKNAKLQKMYFDMGGLLAVGTDPTGAGGTIAGSGNWRAIELLVEVGGFTPLEAIKIATSNGAAAIGVSDTVGTIETGKFADILIIDGNPGEKISDIRKVETVFKRGVGYNSKKLIESMRGRVGFN